jgi:hypothetical protein
MPLFGAFSVVLVFLQAGCAQVQLASPKALGGDVAPGVIVIDILGGGQPMHYWQYLVQPSAAVVRIAVENVVSDPRHPDMPRAFQQPAGSFDSCGRSPRAASPDRALVAFCSKEASFTLHVIDGRSGTTVCEWKSDNQIRGFAWAPNSNSLAILNSSSRQGRKPLELFALVSGHPVNHDNIFLDLLDVKTSVSTKYLIRPDVISSFTRILEWSKA